MGAFTDGHRWLPVVTDGHPPPLQPTVEYIDSKVEWDEGGWDRVGVSETEWDEVREDVH